MTKDEFWATVMPALLTFLGIAIPALLTWIGAILKSWTAKQKEAVDRQALHMALETGVVVAEQKYGGTGSKPDKAAYAVEYAKKSVPDAIANLNPPADVLAKLAIAKREQLETSHAQAPPC